MATAGPPDEGAFAPQPPPPMDQPTAEDKQWAMFAHLSSILLGWLGPLIIWLIYKDKSKFVDYHGKEALNFQLNILVYILISIPLMCAFGIGFVTAAAAGIYSLVMAIIAGLKANNGELYQYPATVRVIQ